MLLALLAAPVAHAQSPGNAPASLAPQTEPTPSQPTGTLTGTVLSTGGAVVTGATVTFTTPNGAPPRTTVSGLNGHFTFASVPSGAFTVRVTLQGFNPLTRKGTLAAGQALDLQPFPLQMATVSFTVTAVDSPEELATEELHTEEHQRLLGVFPNFFVAYDFHTPPLTTRQKFSLATHNAIDPGNLVIVSATAGVQQAENAFPGYHQGAAGYGKRFGADLANLEVGTYMGGAVLPALFHQDPRYFYKGTGTLRSRFFYAVTRAVVARGDNGKWQPAYASVLGDLSAGAISNLYYAPSDRQGATLTLENGFLGVAGDALSNVFQEFVLKNVTPKIRKAASNTAP